MDDIGKMLRQLEYIRVNSPIWKSMINREVIGYNVSASSVLRKPFTLERIKKWIRDNALDLTVFDGRDYLSSFRIMKN